MKTNSTSRSAFFNPRVLIGFVLCSVGVLLALAALNKSAAETPATKIVTSQPGSVTPYGSYATSVVIDVPAYYHIAPQIALRYDSASHDGQLGEGWDLTATSRIDRQSLRRGVPGYNANDIFVLDGQELIPCAAGSASPSCTSGGTHSTKIDDYRKILWDPNANTWKIWEKDGTLLQYSSLLSTALPRYSTNTYRWGLTSVFDTHANMVSYNYGCPNDCYLDSITYGEGVACSTPPTAPPPQSYGVGQVIPGAEIKFFWESRPDPRQFANGRNLVTANQRLKSVRVRHSGWTNRVYVIGYIQSGGSGRSLVNRIQQYGADAVVCENSAGCSGTTYGDITGAATSLPAKTYTALSMGASAGTWSSDSATVTLANSQINYSTTGFTGMRNLEGWDPVPYKYPYQLLECAAPDLNGDGRNDAVCRFFYKRTNSNGSYSTESATNAWLSTRSGWVQTNNGVYFESSDYFADVNGDGLSDLVEPPQPCEQASDNNGTCMTGSKLDGWGTVAPRKIGVRLNNGAGFDAWTFSDVPWPWHNTQSDTVKSYLAGPLVGQWYSPIPGGYSRQRTLIADANGDGMADIIYVYRNPSNNSGNVCVAFSRGYGNFLFPTCQLNAFSWYDDHGERSRIFPGDINGDGRMDVVHVAYHPGSVDHLGFDHDSIDVALSLGDGTFSTFSYHDALQWNDGDSWLPGDINGDGKTDIIRKLKHGPDSVSSVDHIHASIYLSLGSSFRGIAKDTGQRWWRCPGITTDDNQAFFMAADFTGDGRDDLVSLSTTTTCSQSSPSDTVYVSISAPMANDQFAPTNFNFQSVVAPAGQILADINGDGRVDLLRYRESLRSPDCTTFFSCAVNLSLDAYLSPRGAEDKRNLLSGDQNGDGRADLMYVFYKDAGYIISTYLKGAGEAYTRVDQWITSASVPGQTIPVDNPQTTLWKTADLNSDGRSDLVLADHDGSTTLRLYTLLSTGDGYWQVLYQTISLPSSFPAGFVARRWLLMDVNADGQPDLVTVSFSATGTTTVHTLTCSFGTWALQQNTPLTGFTRREALLFMPADANGDGRSDLVLVTSPMVGNTMVYTLLAHPWIAGYFTPVARAFPYTLGTPRQWRALDINNDSADDLVSFERIGNGVRLNMLMGAGNGDYQLVTSPVYTPTLAMPIDDVQNFRTMDVDGDGRGDFVLPNVYKESGALRIGLLTLFNRYPSFSANTQSYWSSPLPLDTPSWLAFDSNADKRGDLVRIGSDATNLRYSAPRDLLTQEQNGLGGSVNVSYQSSVGMHAYMPTGKLLDVVSSTTTSDTLYGGSYPNCYTFTGARWSDVEGRMLGFSTVSTQDTTCGGPTTTETSVVDTQYELSDACGARVTSVATKNSALAKLSETTTSYVALTQYAPPPYNCLVNLRYDYECEGTVPCLSHSRQFTYDAYGNLMRLNDWGDPTTANDDRQIDTPAVVPNIAAYIVGLNDYTNVYQWSSSGWVIQSSDINIYDNNTGWSQAPGPKGEVRQRWQWNSLTGQQVVTRIDYDPQGNVISVTDPSGVYKTIDYDCDYRRLPVSECNALGQCTSQTWNVGRLYVSSTKGLNNETTSYGYDALSRPMWVQSPDLSTTTHAYLSYGSSAQRHRTEVQDGSGSDGVHWSEDYLDGFRRVRDHVVEGAPSNTIWDALTTRSEYADAGQRLRRVSLPFKIGQSPSWTAYEYDPHKRRVKTTMPDGGRTLQSLFTQGRERRTDALGQIHDYFFDRWGRTTTVREWHKTCSSYPNTRCTKAVASDTRYAYDVEDRLTSITDALNRTSTNTYTSLGWKMLSDDRDLGPQSYSYNSNGSLWKAFDARLMSKWYKYDAAGRKIVEQHKDNTGNVVRTITTTYDRDPAGNAMANAIGRVTTISDTVATYKGCYVDAPSRTLPVNISQQTNKYDYTIETCVAAAKAQNLAYAGLQWFGWCFAGNALPPQLAPEADCNTSCSGNSSQSCGGAWRNSVYATAGSSSIVDTLRYDIMGRTYQETRCINGACASMGFSYDPSGRMKTLTYPDGEQLTYNYNGAGQLSSMSNYLLSQSYNSFGQVTETQYANGRSTGRSYDPTKLWPSGMWLGFNNAFSIGQYQVSYSFDNGGQMLSRTQSYPSESTAFAYDDLGRLRRVDSSSTPALAQSFSYDVTGNMNYNSKQGNYGYTDAAHVHAVTTVNGTTNASYDAAGNMTASLTQVYSWDPDSRLSSLYNSSTGIATAYRYDQSAERVSKTVGGLTTNYFSKYYETGPNGPVKYYYAGDKLIAKRSSTGNPMTYYHQDHLGSTRVTTDAGGAVTSTPSYSVFGSATPGQRFGFAQAESDDESGLLYMIGRYQSPAMGRMLSADRIIPNLYDPQALNRYSYAYNSPLRYNDPSGHLPTDVGSWANVVIAELAKRETAVSFAGSFEVRLSAGEGPTLLHRLELEWEAFQDWTGSDESVKTYMHLLPFVVDENYVSQGDNVGSGFLLVIPVAKAGVVATEGVLADANFAQKTFSQAFSSEGAFAGRTVDDVAAALRSGQMGAADVPVQYIIRDGNTLMLNTRSAQALEAAGIPRAQWNAVNMTGDAAAEARLTEQLQRNGLGSQGITTVTPGRR